MKILLKSATIVDKSNPKIHLKKRDILIENGIIKSIATKIDAQEKTQELKLKNLHVSLGWFDSSVSFGEPGFEERETITNGLVTAAKSGFTDVVLNTNTNPKPDSSSDIIFFKEKSKNHCTNLHPLGCLTVNSEGETLAELFDMKNAGAIAFSDFKHSIKNTNLLKIALQYTQNFDGLVLSFADDKSIAPKGVINEGEVSTKLGLKGTPNLAEELQLVRDLYLLEYTGGKLHVPTISTANSVKLIAEAKKKGLDVSCSVAIHNLFFSDEELIGFESNFKVKPALRTKKDTKALQKGLLNGTIDFVTSDHLPIDIEEKKVEFDHAAYGTIGLESAFGVLNQLFSTEETIEFLTKGRNRFGIAIPTFAEGEPACLSLFNPDEEFEFSTSHIFSTSKNSAFIGKKMKGIVYGSINNNKIELH